METCPSPLYGFGCFSCARQVAQKAVCLILLLAECRVKALLMIRHVSRFVRGYARHVTASFHPLCAREQQRRGLVLGVIADV